MNYKSWHFQGEDRYKEVIGREIEMHYKADLYYLSSSQSVKISRNFLNLKSACVSCLEKKAGSNILTINLIIDRKVTEHNWNLKTKQAMLNIKTNS